MKDHAGRMRAKNEGARMKGEGRPGRVILFNTPLRGTGHGSPITFRALTGALAVFMALSLAGCDYLPFGYTTVKEIGASPASFEGKEVKVKGKVKTVAKFFGMQGFILQDETGEITVSTPTGTDLPEAGGEVALRGTVHSAAIVGGSAMGLRIDETKRIR
jgi:hypothetical protein